MRKTRVALSPYSLHFFCQKQKRENVKTQSKWKKQNKKQHNISALPNEPKVNGIVYIQKLVLSAMLV